MLAVMDVGEVREAGLCMQCGTCIAVCPARAIELDWDVTTGYAVIVHRARCTDCGI